MHSWNNIEDTNGSWVRYEDHEEEVQKLIDAGMEENRKAEAWKEKARQQLKNELNKQLCTCEKCIKFRKNTIDEVLK